MSDEAADRRAKLAKLLQRGDIYPNNIERTLAEHFQVQYGHLTRDELEKHNVSAALAGRVMAKRQMSKTSFIELHDASAKIQLMLSMTNPEIVQTFELLDSGDIVSATGTLTKTKTGELSVRVKALRILAKSIHPLPEKFHGLADIETRYRKRYLDLIINADSLAVFEKRSRIIAYLRSYLGGVGFLEVETPMMQGLSGGAAAKPFVTHHNALDMTLYLRVAPELYLKRLLVGGFEKVYELNRNFRNEGISSHHNPEFTMLEFYQAYTDYRLAMDRTEDLLRNCQLYLQEQFPHPPPASDCDLSQPFVRMTFKQALLEYIDDLNEQSLDNPQVLKNCALSKGITVGDIDNPYLLQMALFEKQVEPQLQKPTFVTDYPTIVSPLAHSKPDTPDVAERFELFVSGYEIANGFSELNNPIEQARRLKAQAQQKSIGDDEAMYYDADYIEALEYAMPPAAGVGIGIDRLVMILTGCTAIKDVILFPLLHAKK
ncbi:MAG: lysine--tRNA ligase [Chromatiales bacterium]|nr:lysine--tRNA ligase [Chromatiales bacterium]